MHPRHVLSTLALVLPLAGSAIATADPAATPPDDGPEIACPKSVATWAATRGYAAGDQVRFHHRGEAARVYRCTTGCAAGTRPADPAGAWTLVGHCAARPAAAAPAVNGSAKWDGSYVFQSGGSSDWRCPEIDSSVQLAVSHGAFSLPWQLSVATRRGSQRAGVGHIDGVVHADGTVAVAPVVTVRALPSGLGAGRGGRAHTLDDLAGFAPTATFSVDGGGRRMTLAASTTCEVSFVAADYQVRAKQLKPGENPFPEDGKQLTDEELDQIPEYDSGKSYTFGAIVRQGYSSSPHTLAFRCAQKVCDRSPGSEGWEPAGWY